MYSMFRLCSYDYVSIHVNALKYNGVFCFVYLRSSFVDNVICMPVLFFILYMFFDLAEADIIILRCGE